MTGEKEIQEQKKKIVEALQKTKKPGLDNLVSWLEMSDFYTAPASTMFHGNRKGGLAAHSYQVYVEFKRQVEHYGLSVPEDSCIVTGILHDCCKVNYYIPNVLKSGNVSESKPYRVDESFPVGHGEKSLVLAQRYIPLTNQEAMIIRWHMGQEDPAWNDYKERVEAKFPEVTLFHHADKEVSMILGL
jgi:hypothetical protein